MAPGDLIQVLSRPLLLMRKGTILKVIGSDDRYSKVKIMWHEHDEMPTEISTHMASMIASHCTILCKTEKL